jgi:hypothetical protein
MTSLVVLFSDVVNVGASPSVFVSEVTAADEVMLRDTLCELDLLTDDPILVLGRVTLDLSVLVIAVGCDCAMLELVVIVDPVFRIPLLVRREEELVGRDAEL